MQAQIPDSVSNRTAIAIVFGLALVVRCIVLLWAIQSHSDTAFFDLTPDSSNYVRGAHVLLDGGPMAHRNELFYFPIGYPAFLAMGFGLWGNLAFPFLILQILLSSITCVMVYLIASRLGVNRGVATTAGILSTISVTSISLSTLMLSDTLYNFLFVSALLLLIRACDCARPRDFALAGVLSGSAILVRPIGQLWPAAAIFIVATLWLTRPDKATASSSIRRRLIAGIIVYCLIAWLIPVPWVVRNYRVHGFPVLAITSISARSTIAAKAAGDLSGQDYRSIQLQWEQECVDSLHGEPPTLEDYCRCAQERVKFALANYPMLMVKAYAKWDFENLNAPDYLISTLVPSTSDPVIWLNDFLRRTGLARVRLYLITGGLILLFIGGHRRAFFVLGIAFVYCASTIGAFPYQGSRYFLPGQTIGWIAIAALIVLIFSITRRLLHKQKPPHF